MQLKQGPHIAVMNLSDSRKNIMNASLETFVHNISNLKEADYQSFQKAIRENLSRLAKDLPYVDDERINQRLKSMRGYLDSSTTDGFQKIIEKLSLDAHYIDQILSGIRQLWESASPQ